jgi:hypothetical protein
MYKHNSEYLKRQESEVQSIRCWQFLRDLLGEMNKLVDRRLVKTFLDLVQIILINRHRNNGLLLSELGDFLLGGKHGPAGTKRISNLIHSKGWKSKIIDEFLWKQGDERVEALLSLKEDIYVLWDESVIEKSESLAAEGLCAVRSSKAARLKRIKPGYFNPPGGRPIFVPGMNWLQVLVAGPRGCVTLAHLRWWTTRGEKASDKRTEELQVLDRVAKMWGNWVIHIWDRGFAGAPWLLQVLKRNIRFIVRWKKDYKLIGPDGQAKKAWQITRGKRSQGHREIYDCKRRCIRTTGIIAVPVFLPDEPSRQLWLVVSRPGHGRTPWYLLTSDPIQSTDDAWRVTFAYARRWQIEMSIRFTKSELAFECPRLLLWETRKKLLLIAALSYAFLLSLLQFDHDPLFDRLIDLLCFRTGKWSRVVSTPLYRLRLAFSRLWIAYRPISLPLLDSG